MRSQPRLLTRKELTGSFPDRLANDGVSRLHPGTQIPERLMGGDMPKVNPESVNRRRLPRKQTLLKGVVTDLNHKNATDCTIRDLNVLGAQVGLPLQLPVGTQIILLDTSNATAHIASVAWSSADRAGLSFVQSHAMGLGLPPRLNFLWKLLLEAKLKDIDRVVARGAPVKLATATVGLTESLLHRMSPHVSTDSEFERLLASARRLLEE